MDNMSGGKSALGLDANVAALLAYLPICAISLIMSIIIVVTDKTNKLARFHAFQSLLLIGAFVALYVVIMIFGVVAAAANSTAIGLLVFLLYIAWIIGFLGISILGMIKGFQGQIFKLPIIGDMADKWSN